MVKRTMRALGFGSMLLIAAPLVAQPRSLLSLPPNPLAEPTSPAASTSPTIPSATAINDTHSGLSASQLGLIINIDDPYSVAIGAYYQQQRGIPDDNIVQVRLPTDVASISRSEFAPIKTVVDAMLPAHVQALAIAWTNPSRVECNSMTSALARGFVALPCDADRSQTQGKSPTCMMVEPSPYFASRSTQPYTDFRMRPAMMLAAPTLAQGKALIDRGITADNSHPHGSAYIMRTTDNTRSLRAKQFPAKHLGTQLSPAVDVQVVQKSAISDTRDALFYFQGLTRVKEIDSNRFPPGAIADNLTSFGGMLTDPAGRQMSVLEFIAAGVTGTFGTVSEPCALAMKFPDPSIVIAHYSGGETLIEAYWKSVEITFQGIFVGEPLANPWRRELVSPSSSAE